MSILNCLRGGCVVLLMTVSAFAQASKTDPFSDGFYDRAKPGEAMPKPSAAVAVPVSKLRASFFADQPAATTEDYIRFRLSQPATVDAVDESIANAVNRISESQDLPMAIDLRSLEEVGLDGESLVLLTLKNVKLRTFLQVMLADHDLTYVIKHERLIVITKEDQNKYTTMQTYRLPEALSGKSEQVLQVMITTVAPDKWNYGGGANSVALVDNVMIVTAPESVHEQIAEFLDKLQTAFQ